MKLNRSWCAWSVRGGLHRWLLAVAMAGVLAACGPRASETSEPSPEPEPAAVSPTPEPQAGPEPESPPEKPVHATFRHKAMGTEFEFTLYTRPGDVGTDGIMQVAEQAFAAIDLLESRVSTWLPDSQTTYVNNRAAEQAVRVAPDIHDLLVYAKEIYTETDGAFDVTVGPLIELWGFYEGEGRLPTEEELQAALAVVGMDKVEIDAEERTVKFSRPRMRLDFGGIAKGLALDAASEVLEQYGVTSGILHAGTSTVLAMGTPPGEPGWTVRIRHPYNNKEYIDEVTLVDESLSTSGSYEKFFELNGKKYCHIFDPRTGQPVEGVLSATVIAGKGMRSDALSTALFVLGEEKARTYCRDHSDIRAVFVPVPEHGEPQPRRINFPAQ